MCSKGYFEGGAMWCWLCSILKAECQKPDFQRMSCPNMMNPPSADDSAEEV